MKSSPSFPQCKHLNHGAIIKPKKFTLYNSTASPQQFEEYWSAKLVLQFKFDVFSGLD